MKRPVVFQTCHVARYREDAGLTQVALAEACGVSLSAVSDAEAGKGICLLTAMRIARVLGKTIEELWEEKREVRDVQGVKGNSQPVRADCVRS